MKVVERRILWGKGWGVVAGWGDSSDDGNIAVEDQEPRQNTN